MHIIWSETLGRRLASAKSLAKRLAESLTESLAETLYETLDETFGETLGESLTKSLAETLSETLDETFGETLGETFRARQAFPQNLGSDYMNGSPQESLRDSFFLRGTHWPCPDNNGCMGRQHIYPTDSEIVITMFCYSNT